MFGAFLFPFKSCFRFICLFFLVFVVRTHANGSIKRGSKDNATDAVQLRTGIGVQLKDIKVFNKARQQGGWVGVGVGGNA